MILIRTGALWRAGGLAGLRFIRRCLFRRHSALRAMLHRCCGKINPAGQRPRAVWPAQVGLFSLILAVRDDAAQEEIPPDVSGPSHWAIVLTRWTAEGAVGEVKWCAPRLKPTPLKPISKQACQRCLLTLGRSMRDFYLALRTILEAADICSSKHFRIRAAVLVNMRWC